MTTGYISASNAEAYMAQFVHMAVEAPVGVFHTISGTQKAKDYTEAEPKYDEYERTFTAIQRGTGKYIYSFTDNYDSTSGMGFHAQQLAVVAVVVADTVYMVDAYGYNIGVTCFFQDDFLQKITSATNFKVALFRDFLETVSSEITASLQAAYDKVPVDDVLSSADKEGIRKELRKYTISDTRQKNMEALTCYPFPTADAQTIAAILCGVEDQDAVTADMIAAERDGMVLHKAVRDYALEQIKAAYENPDKNLRMAMGLDQAPKAKTVWVTFCVDDQREKLKIAVDCLRSLLSEERYYLNYWHFSNEKQAEFAMTERLGVNALYACDIDMIEFGGKILYSAPEE